MAPNRFVWAATLEAPSIEDDVLLCCAMQWQRIREHYPHRWLLVEAIEAHSSEGRRVLDELTVVQEYPAGEDAMRGYLDLHRRSPDRELYVLHTDRETLDVDEREWLGLRRVG